jgi:hypothetical protein
MIAYTLFMQNKYGADFVEELYSKRHEIHKFTSSELEEIMEEIKKRIKELDEETSQ